MAIRTLLSGRSAAQDRPRWPVVLLLAALAGPTCAADRQPLEVRVTPSTASAPYVSAINEDGIVEANAARVQDGVVYLEFRPQTAADTALTADAR